MATYTIEYSTDGGSSWNTINKYRNFEIKNGIGRNLFAPIGKIWANVNTSASLNDILRIQINNTTRFEGYIKDDGNIKQSGVKVLEGRGYGYEIMDEVVDLNLSNVSPETVLENALDATTNSDYDSSNLTTPTATNITLDTYDVEQKVRKIFKEMMSRAGYIIRFFPDKTVNFESFENGGSLGSISEFKLRDYTENNKDTVVNKVKVFGTYGDNVYSGTASDFSYVDDVKQKNYNVRYVYSDAEAQNLAEKRLRPEPSDTGKLVLFGDDFHADNIANYTFDFTSDAFNLGTKTVVVEKQIIREEHNEVHVGKGVDYGIFENGLSTFSSVDKNEPGADNTDEVLNDKNIEDGADVTADHQNDIYLYNLASHEHSDLDTISREQHQIFHRDDNTKWLEGNMVVEQGIGTTKLAITQWLPNNISYSLDTSTSPNTLSVSYDDMVYDGTNYGSDSISTQKKYVIFDESTGGMVAQDTKPSLGDDDALLYVQRFEDNEVDPILLGTMINGSSIITMYLETAGDARFGTGNSEYISFIDDYTYNQHNYGTALVPENDGSCSIGSDPKRYKHVWSKLGIFGEQGSTYSELYIGGNDKDAELIPEFSGACKVGTDTLPLGQIHSDEIEANNYLKVPVGADQYPT